MLGFRSAYWVWPLLCTVAWTATLVRSPSPSRYHADCSHSAKLGLLLWWSVADRGRPYKPDHPTIVLISHVGAAHRVRPSSTPRSQAHHLGPQELFIPGSALTFVLFTITLATEHWLRHIRRIPGPLRKSESITELTALCFGILGGVALLLLSIFDAFNHKRAHWVFTAIFVLTIALSAAFGTAQTMLLERSQLRFSLFSSLSPYQFGAQPRSESSSAKRHHEALHRLPRHSRRDRLRNNLVLPLSPLSIPY